MHTRFAPVLTPVRLAALLRERPDTRLLDVRTPGEFEAEHIAGAYNVPLDTLGEHGAAIRAVAEPVVLICRSGQRARRAEHALRGAGMANLHVLDGGMMAWTTAGLPVRRGAPQRSPLPSNGSASCDVEAMVRALTTGAPPGGSRAGDLPRAG